jgi:hypothetical protein
MALKVGDRVLYRGMYGADAPKLGTIVGMEEDEDKGGTMIYDVDLDDGATHWGYTNQFTAVNKG